MYDAWRADGFGADVLEVWAIGWPGQESYIAAFAAGSAVPCLIDTNWQFISAYSPSKDDLWVVGKDGNVSFSMSLIGQPVTSSAGATLLDNAVRAALR